MATNFLSDETPYEDTIAEELAENGGLPADSPVHAYVQRADDPIDQLLRGMQDEAEGDAERARQARAQELAILFQNIEPATPRAEIEASARSISEREAAADYSTPINPEYSREAHGELKNPNSWASWFDQLADSRVVNFIQGIDKAINPQSVGRMALGGITDAARATLGSLEMIREAATKVGLGATSPFGESLPEPEGPSPIEQVQALIPEVPKSEEPLENIGRGLIQFASFFIPVMGTARAIGYGGKLTAATVSALESFSNRNPDDQTLSTFVTQIAPGLENTPVIGPALEFLKSDPDDSEALRRFKFLIEDVAVGQLIDLGLDAKGTVQSIGNMFDTVRQAKAGKIAKDILADESGSIWFGRPKEEPFLSGPIEPEPVAAPVSETLPETPAPPVPQVDLPPAVAAPEAVPVPAAPGLPTPGQRPPLETPPARPEEPPQAAPVPRQYQSTDAKLADIAAQYNAEYESFRRQDVRHIKDVMAEAQNMGVRPQDFANLQPGTVLNDTATAALGQLQEREATKIIGLIDSYERTGTPAAAEALTEGIKDFALLNPRAMGAGREAGRTLRTLQETEIGRSASIRNLEKAIGEAEATKSLDVLVQTFKNLEEPPKIASFLNGIGRAGKVTQSTLAEVYVNALLSKPATFVRNMIGSTVFLEGLVAERMIAGIIDKPVSLIFGRDGSGVSVSEARAMIHGQWVAKSKALAAVAHGFKEEPFSTQLGDSAYAVSKQERPKAITAENYGLDPNGLMGKMVNFAGRQVRLPGRVMAAGDAVNRTLARDAQLHALAYRKAREAAAVARRSGEKGKVLRQRFNDTYQSILHSPSFQTQQAVERFGNMATFTDQAGPLAQGLTGIVEKLPLLRLVLPFINTPARLISQSVQRVPILGLMARENRDALIRGTRADREIVAAKQAMGMGIAGIVGYLALSGRITGEGSRNKTMRAAEYGSKIPPRSIGVGADEFGNPTQWIPYNNVIEPYGSTLGFFADLAASMPLVIDSYMRGKTEPMNAASEAFGAMSQALVNFTSKKSYLVGINNIIDALSDDSGKKMQRVMGDLAAGFIPNIVRSVETTTDQDIQEAKTAWERFKRAIPIWNDDLKVKRNPVTGEPERRPKYFNPMDADDPATGALLLMLDLSTPANPVTRGEDPETEWIFENILKDQLTGIGLEVSDTLHGVKLEDGELDRLEVLRAQIKVDDTGQLSASGDNLRDRLLKTMQSGVYQQSEPGPDGGKEWLVRSIFRAYSQIAEAQLLTENPELAAEMGVKKLEGGLRQAPGVLSPEGQQEADRIREEASHNMQMMVPR
jgi:hypothetical protein